MDEENTQATQPNDGSFHQTKPRPWGHLASLVHTHPHMDLFHTEYYFGRKKECVLYFKDPRISAEHCRIYRRTIASDQTATSRDSDNVKVTDDSRTATALKQFEPPNLENDFSVYIEDLSSNGTFVNGTRIGKGNSHLLKHKDTISLVGRYGSSTCVAAYSYQDSTIRDLENDPSEDIINQKYQIGGLLGTGNFSNVRLGISRQTGQKFAIKVIDKMKYYNNKALDQIAREVDILKQIKHPNIITIIDCFSTKRYIYLVLELAMGGELFERIMNNGNYNEDEARKVFVQMLQAVDYLHDRGIAHRDLKPENILLQNRDSNLIKISDFGLAKLVGEREMMTTLCGTPQYAAPEIVAQTLATQNHNNTSSAFVGYGKEVDMWSLGAILYVLLSGTLPFDEERSLTPLFIQIQHGQLEFPPEFWMEISEEAKDLIRKLMTVDPKLRLDVKQALQHPWVTGTTSSQSKQLQVSTNLRKNKSQLMGVLSPIKARPLTSSGNSDTEDETTKSETRSPKPEADNFLSTTTSPPEFQLPKPAQKSSISNNNNNNNNAFSTGSKEKLKPESIIILDNSPSRKKGKENQVNFVDLTESPLVTKTRPKRKSTGSTEEKQNTKKKLNFSS